MTRQIIEIDEEKCDGCGQCVIGCAEGALAIVDGKAKLVGEALCDGLGACIGECPQGALTIVNREAEEFDEEAVARHLEAKKAAEAAVQAAQKAAPKVTLEPAPTLACGCPSTQEKVLTPRQGTDTGPAASALSHWPVKLRLITPQAGFLKGRDLVLLADCAACADPNLHGKTIRDRAVALCCPKFEDPEAAVDKLADIIATARPASLTVEHMEVPCCSGLSTIARKAVEKAGGGIPVTRRELSAAGDVNQEERLAAA